MDAYWSELFGTLLLVLLGDGVVANVVLQKTKGHAAGWLTINIGWGMAVFVAVFCTSATSGAHLNPAVTLAVALSGSFPWAEVPAYVAVQVLGGGLGASLVWL
ncbi:MAG: aquaporin, partial [Myxococcota bacterium]